MHGVVKFKGSDILYSLLELPEDRDELEFVEEGGGIFVPFDIADWPEGTDRPSGRTLGRSLTDPKRYRLFKHASELAEAGYEPTGLTYGGAYSPEQWERLVKAPSK